MKTPLLYLGNGPAPQGARPQGDEMKARRTIAKLTVATVAALAATGPAAMSNDLVYTPMNPSFGGNPNYTSHLMGTANAQRTATASDADDGSGGSPGDPGDTPGSSDAELFVRQLQGRLLSALASEVTESIFGENPQDSGTVQFGDTTVSFERTLSSIRLVISEPTGETEIVVPQLEIN